MHDVLGGIAKSGLIAVHPEPDRPRARSLVADGAASPPRSSSRRVSRPRCKANRAASLQVIGNADAPISTEVARSIAEGYTAELNRVRLSVATRDHRHGRAPASTKIAAARRRRDQGGCPVPSGT